MANKANAKKRDPPNMVHWNQRFADRIRHEEQACQEWADKWGIDPESEKKKEKLLVFIFYGSITQILHL